MYLVRSSHQGVDEGVKVYFSFDMDGIQFKKTKDRRSITLWFSEGDDSAVDLYETLKSEHNVDTPTEARKAISERLKEIAIKLSGKKAC